MSFRITESHFSQSGEKWGTLVRAASAGLSRAMVP